VDRPRPQLTVFDGSTQNIYKKRRNLWALDGFMVVAKIQVSAPSSADFSAHIDANSLIRREKIMRRRAMFTLLVLCLVAVMAATAGAQGQRGQGGRGQSRGGFGGFGGGRGSSPSLSSILAIREVQQEIELSEEQIAEYTAARDKVSEGIRDLFRSRPESDEERKEMGEKMTKLQKGLDRDIEEALLPHQLDRVWELFVQRYNSNSLTHEVIAKKLKITADQKEELAKVVETQNEKRQEALRGLFGNRGGGNAGGGDAGGRGTGGRGGFNADAFAKIREQMEEMQKDTEKARLAVLTSTQRTEFEKMKGEKFEFPERQARGGRTGGDRGGRTGGRPGGDRGGRPGGDRGGRPSGDRPSGDRGQIQ
jgi:uncharacterized membrane protein YgcG